MTSNSPLQPTLGELFATLTQQIQSLLRGEVALLKAQVKEKGQKMGLGIGLFVGAAVFAGVAGLVLVATAILALALVLPAWLAALIVAVVFLLIAAVLGLVGKKQLDAANRVKPAIKENIQQDITIVKEGLK